MAQMENNKFDIPSTTSTPDLRVIEGFDDVPRTKRIPKFVKLLGGTALGLVIVAAIGGVVATQFIDQDHYKKLAAEKIAEQTGYTVDWKGDIDVSLLPLPHVSVHDLTISNGAQSVVTVKSASVDVALLPLLSKKVDIKNITIDTPLITLVTSKAGQQTWMTEALKAPNKPDALAKANDANATADDKPMDVSVGSIKINDGRFIWDDQSSDSKNEIDQIDVQLNSESLSGPFDLEGKLRAMGQSIVVKATTGQIDGKGSQVPVKLDVKLPQSDANLNFAGSVDINPSFKATGDITIQAAKIETVLKDLTGKSPDLPKGIGGKLNLAGKIVTTDKRMALDEMMFALGGLSYSGGVSVAGYGETTPPVLSFQLTPNGKVEQDASSLAKLLSDLTISGKGTVVGNKVNIETASIKAQGNDVTIHGSVITKGPLDIDMTVSSKKLDLDGLQQTLGADNNGNNTSTNSGASSSDDAAGVTGFSVPFSGHLAADLGQLTVGGKTYANISVDMRNGKSGLSITKLNALLPAATNVSVSGTVANTADLSGMDIKLVADTQNTEDLLKAFMAQPPSLPHKIGAASVNGRLTGSLQQLGFDATLGVRGLSVTGKGAVKDVTRSPIINQLDFAVKHQNFVEAIRILSPEFDGGRSFAGPLSMTGQVKWDKDTYHLANLKGVMGGTSVGGDVAIIMAGKPDVSGNLIFGDVVLPTSSKAAANKAAGGAGGVQGSSSGHWSREPIDAGMLKSFDADVKISARSITQNLWILSNANLDARLKDGELQIKDLSANMFGGKSALNGTIRAGSGDHDPISVDAKVTAQNVDARSVMSAVMGMPSDTVQGTLTEMSANIAATGASQSALVQTLSGKGAMAGKDLIVNGIDVVQLASVATGSYKPLDRLSGLAGSVSQKKQTRFDTYDGQFSIDSGVINLQKSSFDSQEATLATTGTVDLPAWMLNLKNIITLKSGSAEPIKFDIKGSLDNPAQSGLESFLFGRIDKLMGKSNTKLGKTLGKFLGSGNDAAADAQAPATVPSSNTTDVPVQDAAPQVNPQEKAAEEAVKALQGLFGKKH